MSLLPSPQQTASRGVALRLHRFPQPEHEGKNMVYVFDSEDKFELTYDELVEIISKARMAGPKLIPVLGTVN